ncbi:PEP-CTERM sorting domain-containing protein [Aurantiacibacter sp. D1-12]|nr:PEP-CTERM sorting domain-containing protein [Aurantiacibacter sp. D1-12]MDE1467204.1 PEP-CTERM sorting domain-containing protein [Aurantiacibacter sp. D1-12]
MLLLFGAGAGAVFLRRRRKDGSEAEEGEVAEA